jgi:hypothetical protein
MSSMLSRIGRRVEQAKGKHVPSQWERMDARRKAGWTLVRYVDHQGTRLAKWMPPPGQRAPEPA